MTRKTPKFGLALLLGLVVLAPRWTAQEIDPKTAEKVQAKEKELEAAQELFAQAESKLQDRYAELRSLYEAVASGQTDGPARDLERVISDVFEEAKAARSGGDGKRKASKAFSRGVGKALDKVENALLRFARPLLDEPAIAQFDEIVEQLDRTGRDEYCQALQRRLFPVDRPFHVFWNESAADLAPESAAFISAAAQRRKVSDEIRVLRDPKIAWTLNAPEGMARIPKTSINMEATEGFKRKKRSGRTGEFFIDLHEVSHGDYWSKFWVNLTDRELKAAYLPRCTDAKGKEEPIWKPNPDTGEYEPLPDQMNKPVTGIDLVAAMAYAASQKKRLPTEAEWMAAACAEPGKLMDYPWGDKYVEGLAADRAAKLESPTSVDAYPEGRSAFGVYNLSGNVKEWVATTVDGVDITEVAAGVQVCLRGGSFEGNPAGISLKWRWEIPARGTRTLDIGFRCAADLP